MLDKPDILMLPMKLALQELQGRGVAVTCEITRPRSGKFVLLDDHFVVRIVWNGKDECVLVVAAKMGKEVR